MFHLCFLFLCYFFCFCIDIFDPFLEFTHYIFLFLNFLTYNYFNLTFYICIFQFLKLITCNAEVLCCLFVMHHLAKPECSMSKNMFKSPVRFTSPCLYITWYYCPCISCCTATIYFV